MTMALAASELRSHFSRLLGRSGLLLCRFCRSSFSFGLWCLFTLLRLALSCWLRRFFAFLCRFLLCWLNLWMFPGDSQELFKLIVLIGYVKSVIVPAILLPVEYLRRQHVSLSLLLHRIRPHEVPLLLHAGGGDVAELDGDAEALEDHCDSVLRVLDLLVAAVPADKYLDRVLGNCRGGSGGLCLTHLSCRSESSNKS